MWDWLVRVRAAPISTLIAVGFAVFTDGLVYGMVVPIFTPEVLGVSNFQLGVLFGGYAGGLLLCTPLFGILSDKFGRKWPMLTGLIGLSAATLILAFIQEFAMMVIARFMQGAAAAATWVAGLALMADTYPKHELGSALGLVMTSMSMGLLLGPPFGGFVYEFGGYRLPFLIAAGLAILDAVIRILLVAERRSPSSPVMENDDPTCETPLMNQDAKVLKYSSEDETIMDPEKLQAHLPEPVRSPPNFFQILLNRNVFVTNIIVTLGANTLTVLEPTLPAYLHEQFNTSAITIGLVFTALSMAHGFTAPVFGWLTDKLGGRMLMMVGLITMAASLPFLSLPNNLWLMIPAVIAVGASTACALTPTMAELAATVDQMGGGAYGQVYAIFNWFYAVGMLGGPLIGGALVDFVGFHRMLFIFCAASLAFAPVAMLHWWDVKRKESNAAITQVMSGVEPGLR